uniref:C-type lectin domain-containing protein n=1 Tax=Takifugu rubripes TaxID=31033 RepID=A0A674NK99_TAKRU
MFPAQPEPLSVEYNYNSSAKSNKSICAFSDSEAPNGTAEERNKFDKLGKFKVREASDVQNRCGHREYCLQEGADLAIINSRAEQVGDGVWIWEGGGRVSPDWVTWRWVDGTPLTESYWSLGEPNNYEGRQEQCVEQIDREDKKGWNDLVCEFSNFYMCEKRIFP